MFPIPIVVITGPTATGKSALAVKLAKKRNGEVISADSRQVYKGLDIGTGKVTKREMLGVRHHLLDVCSPKKVFTAHDFARLGRAAIADIHARGKLPIICGGTGFYIDALLGRVSLADVQRNESLRSRLEKKSAAQLYALLKKRDPKRAAQMDTPSERNNRVRLIRALEIASARPSTNFRGRVGVVDTVEYEVEWVYVDRPDPILRKRIHDRLVERMKAGMVAEARRMHEKGLSWKRMEALGLEYRYLSRYLRGQMNKAEMLRQLEAEIWHYAKRQRTWWRRIGIVQ
jgi:tRNA dimethylallyltransferase